MFYDKELMNSKSLGMVWRAAHNVGDEPDDQVSVINICNKLDSWVDSNHEEVHRRLALRASAVLVDGAARLYKRKMQLLYNDIEKLDKEMSLPKRSRYLAHYHENETENTSSTISENQGVGPEAETSTPKTSEMSTHSRELNISTDLESNYESTNAGNSQHNGENNTMVPKVDKGVQTNLEEHAVVSDVSDFDQNLPFGFVIVHNNYHSRIPSRIIFSSFSPEVSKIV